MSLTYTEDVLAEGVRLIVLKGTFDSDVAMNEGDEIRQLVMGQGGTVVVNLAEVPYVSSAGLRVFMVCAKDLDAAGGALHLAAPQQNVMAALTITGFVPAFPVYRTMEEAMEALSA